jgi:mannose-6-phosphate isomerase
LKRLLRLKNPIRDYAWGSTTLLPRLMGRPTTGEPEAELWMGAHPAAPSSVVLGEGRSSGDSGTEIRLDELVALHPLEVLGAQVLKRNRSRSEGPRFPFLLKILAADRPLSIQTHPSARQAREGFERENHDHLDPADPKRCYRDPLAKHELVCAFADDFPVLSGFRAREETLANLRSIASEEISPWIHRLATGSPAEGYRYFLGELLAARAVPLDRALLRRLRGSERPEHRWTAKLEERFPGDPMALGPLFLHLVNLAPGQALATEAGTLHSYLGGLAVELMTPSDNVLRGGLTSKHVDRPELLRIMSFEPADPRILEPPALEAGGVGVRTYRLPAEGEDLALALDRIDLRPGARHTVEHRGGVEILLSVAGRVEGTTETGEPLEFGPGEALLVPSTAKRYWLSALDLSENGVSTVFRARCLLE